MKAAVPNAGHTLSIHVRFSDDGGMDGGRRCLTMPQYMQRADAVSDALRLNGTAPTELYFSGSSAAKSFRNASWLDLTFPGRPVTYRTSESLPVLAANLHDPALAGIEPEFLLIRGFAKGGNDGGASLRGSVVEYLGDIYAYASSQAFIGVFSNVYVLTGLLRHATDPARPFGSSCIIDTRQLGFPMYCEGGATIPAACQNHVDLCPELPAPAPGEVGRLGGWNGNIMDLFGPGGGARSFMGCPRPGSTRSDFSKCAEPGFLPTM